MAYALTGIANNFMSKNVRKLRDSDSMAESETANEFNPFAFPSSEVTNDNDTENQNALNIQSLHPKAPRD